MVVDQFTLRICDGVFHGVQLLREIKARPLLLEHVENRPEVTMSALEPGDDLRMGGVFHGTILSRGIG
jgi:hypothetical protein